MQLAENLVVAGRFRLNRMIGRGGMGSVWHATHLGLDTACAVKFIEGEFASIPEAQARFEREAKAAAQLRSPHVVTIMDHGVWENTPYIAMELLDGEDLGKRLLARNGKLPAEEVNTVVQQVCRALTKAHQARIVHRDLKPDNIFLVRDDDREIVKVLDFGIAKKNSTGLDTGNNTKTGAMLGTPYYMSPEQAQGIKTVDERSDLWSLAVIVFQALTGKLPFESEALGDLLVKIIVAPIPVPSQVAKVPPQFDRWWARAADRDPNKRYQTAKEFADSLALVLGQSAMTDVMDRAALQAAMGTGTAVLPHGGPRPMGNMSTPQPGGPHMNTPQPGGAPHMGTPQPLMNTPNPGFGPQTAGAAGFGPGALGPQHQQATGAPLARTFGTEPAGLPKKGGGAVIAMVGGVLVLVIGGGGALFYAKGRKSAAHEPSTVGAASSLPAGELPAATGAPVDPVVPTVPKPAQTAAAPASPATGATPASDPSSPSATTAANVPPPAKPGHTPPSGRPQAGGGGSPPTTPAKPGQTPPAGAAKPGSKPYDPGF